MEYSAYGLITYRSGSTDTPFLFNGRYGVQADANGLLHMRARYYNPHICRFVNPDPIGFTGGINFYAYVDGNPISMIDPFGLGALGESGGGSWLTLMGNGLNNTVSGIGQSMGQGLFDLMNMTWSQSEYNRIADLMFSMSTPENPAATPYVVGALSVSAAATTVAGGGIIWSAVSGGSVAGGGTISLAQGEAVIGVTVNGQVVPGSVMALTPSASHAIAAQAGGALTAQGTLIPGAQAFTAINSGGQITVLGSGTFGGTLNVSQATVTAARAVFSAAP
jgi:RHS repeat-associated protein